MHFLFLYRKVCRIHTIVLLYLVNSLYITGTKGLPALSDPVGNYLRMPRFYTWLRFGAKVHFFKGHSAFMHQAAICCINISLGFPHRANRFHFVFTISCYPFFRSEPVVSTALKFFSSSFVGSGTIFTSGEIFRSQSVLAFTSSMVVEG